jgi:hypothetical protein
MVAQMLKKFPTFIEPEGSFSCSQVLNSGPNREPDESNPFHHTVFRYGFNTKHETITTYNDCCLLRCDAVWFGRYLPTFRRNVFLSLLR